MLLVSGLASVFIATAVVVVASFGATSGGGQSVVAHAAEVARSSGQVVVAPEGPDVGSTLADTDRTEGADSTAEAESGTELEAEDIERAARKFEPDLLGRPVEPPIAKVVQPNPGADLGDEPFVPPLRPDGIEFVYADGQVGPIVLGSSIDEIAAALGPDYDITPEASIRAGFGSGHSITNDGEVLFWCIEEDGVITVAMTTSPRVGLDSGLRSRLPLKRAIAVHGEPSFRIGPDSREFVSFDDGAGDGDGLSVLVAIGRFGGPVGVYEAGPDIGSETTVYEPGQATVNELWFWAPGR